MVDESTPLPVRTRFGGYEITRMVGKGGMGIVYHAIETALGRDVALKVLREELRSQAHLVTRFQREARAAASLSHPNIVQIHSVGVQNDVPYIAMDYIQSRPLSVVLQEDGKLPWKRALAIAEQVGRALDCAHEAHIVHRDIKPANILIDANDHAYVTDFGVAKILTADTQLTVDGSRIGTPQYMSPERCRGDEVTASSDLYSLGVVIFQMISGRLPYEASSSSELINLILSEPPARLRDLVPDVPDDVDRLVAYLLEKKPRNRPSSAAAASDAIARVLEGRPLDDADTALAEALAAFRGSMDTPVPTKKKVITPKEAPKSRWGRLQREWQGFPRWVRWMTITSAALSVLLLFSAFALDLLRRDRLFLENTAALETGAWFEANTLGVFTDEGPNVRLGQIMFQRFSLGPVYWSDAETAVAELRGAEKSPWKGHRVLVSLQPNRAAVQMSSPVLPPLPSSGLPALQLLAPVEGGGLLARYVTDLAHSAIVYDPSPTDNVMPQVILESAPGPMADPSFPPEQVQNLAQHPGTKVFIIGLSDPDTGTALFERGQDSSPTRLTDVGPPIERLTYSAGGQVLAFFRRNSSTDRRLHLLRQGILSRNTEVLAGDLRLGTRPFSPDASMIVCVKDKRAVILSVVDAKAVDIGEALDAVWHPSGAFLLLAANDSRGKLQVWAVEVAGAQRRLQLTSLEEGVQPALDVSPNGQYCTAPLVQTGNVPMCAFVRTDSIIFQ